MKIDSRLAAMFVFTLAGSVSACMGEVGDPTSGDSEPAAALDSTQAAELAQAESAGLVSQDGRVLSTAEGDAVARDRAGADAQNEDETLVQESVPGRDVKPVNLMLRTTSGQFSSANVWFNFPQWGGWINKGCFALPKPGTWKNVAFSIPNDVDVFFDGFKVPCNKAGDKPDLQVVMHSPKKPTLTNWWVMVF